MISAGIYKKNPFFTILNTLYIINCDDSGLILPYQKSRSMVMLTRHTRNWIVEIISYLFVLLFVYAAVSKLLDFENFQVQLGQSPLLSAYAGIIAPSIIIIELIVSLLLSIKSTRLIGLYCSLFLMVGFTAYIFLILNYSDFIPCSCGGVIEELNWSQHLVF